MDDKRSASPFPRVSSGESIASWLGQQIMPYRHLRNQNEALIAQVQELRISVVDVLSATELVAEDDQGSNYTNKKTTVDALYTAYANEAQWGSQIIQRIVNQRKALVMPYGVKVQKSAEIEREERAARGDGDQEEDGNAEERNEEIIPELKFIRDMLDYNQFPEGREDSLSKQAELEGEVLVTLHWDPDAFDGNGMVRIKRKRWSDLKYEIATGGGTSLNSDVDDLQSVSWRDSEGQNDLVVLTPGAGTPFSFAAFNAIDFIGMPAAGYALNECENLHKALVGWRKVNRYFAKQTPFFKAESEDEAKSIFQRIRAAGWKIGMAFAGKDMKLVGPTGAMAELIYAEIRTNAQVISGTTGLPVHHLGFADVLSNRATAETLTEPLEIIAIYDMGIWRGFYEHLFVQAIRMANEFREGQMRENAVKPQLLPMSDRQWQRMEKVWAPLAIKGVISRELLLDQVPDMTDEERREELARHLEGLQEASFDAAVEELRAGGYGLDVGR